MAAFFWLAMLAYMAVFYLMDAGGRRVIAVFVVAAGLTVAYAYARARDDGRQR